jgi:hypothetical protein
MAVAAVTRTRISAKISICIFRTCAAILFLWYDTFDNIVVLIYTIIHTFTKFINSIFSFTGLYGIINITMPFPPLPPKVYDFAARIKAALGSLFQIMRQGAVNVRVRAQAVFDRLAEKLPSGRQRLVVGVSIIAFSVIVLILVGVSAARGSRESKVPVTAGTVRQGFILPDELYLPNEPDFVPGVLLEREQRTMWTTSDAAPLWQDPLKDGEEPWRNRIERTIDDIMESVP